MDVTVGDGHQSSAATDAAATGTGKSNARGWATLSATLRRNVNVAAIVLIVIALMLTFTFASPYFLTARNLVNMVRQVAAPLVAGVGMTMVLAIAGIDLSIGSVLTLGSAGYVVLLAHHLNGSLVVIAMLAVGLAVGLLNGYVVAYQRLPAFIVTLAGLVAFQGVAELLTQGQSFPASGPAWLVSLGEGSAGPIPNQLFLEAVVVWAGWYTLNRLRFGKYMLGIGSNEEAVRRAGVSTRGVILAVYVISALSAMVAGLIETARIGSGSAELSQNFELLVIAGVVLGGTSLFGGRATIAGTVFGVWALEIINNGLILVHVSSYWVPIVEGAIVLGAVLLNSRVFSQLRIGQLASR